MKISHLDIKKGVVKVGVENLDDLWYLSTIIDKGDFVKGQTVRKVRIGEKEERSAKIVKKKVSLKIEVDNIEFHKFSDVLRVGGKIVEGPEDIPKGSHHTFNVGGNTLITIIKERWLKFQLDKLKEACQAKLPKILICVMDRENAYFAMLKKFGYELITKIEGDVEKKAEGVKGKGKFYPEIIKLLKEYAAR